MKIRPRPAGAKKPLLETYVPMVRRLLETLRRDIPILA